MKPQSLKELLTKKIPPHIIKKIRRAYDLIGGIAILEIPRGLERYEKTIAQALIATSPTITTVAKKVGGHGGIYRRQRVRLLAGRRSKTTLHTEHGITLKVHVEDAYFSPRLATERARIAKLVQPGEDVLVMFSGIAPYLLVIARLAKPHSIVGIEINPKAHRLALENLMLNRKISSPIQLYVGDVKQVLPTIHRRFDRVIMPLPKGAKGYLGLALKTARKRAFIHYYDFCPEDSIGRIGKEIAQEIQRLGRAARLMSVTRCGQSSVREYRVCVDFQMLD